MLVKAEGNSCNPSDTNGGSGREGAEPTQDDRFPAKVERIQRAHDTPCAKQVGGFSLFWQGSGENRGVGGM
jgi:hypothetical protein